MADEPIKGEELIDKDVFKDTAESADVLLEKLSLLIGGFRELARITGSKISSGIDPKSITDVEKLTEAKAKLAKMEQGLTEIEKVQQTIVERRKKANKELAYQLKSQGGILGELIIKQKQLKEGLLTAKSTTEIKKINQELFKTNGEIKKIKDGGSNAFNSWANALQSFQFKFNTLGATIGQMAATGLLGLVSVIGDFAMAAGKAMFEAAKGTGLFGESIKNTKLNTEALQGALDAVEAQLARIGKSQKEIVADALGFGSGAKRLALEQALRDANRIGTEGLSEEDLKKAIDQRQDIQDQLVALDAEDELKRIQAKKEGIKKELDVAKDGSDAELRLLRNSLEARISLIKSGRDQSGSIDDRLSRQIEMQEAMEAIDAEFAKRKREADKKAAAEDLKDREAADKKLLAQREKALKDQLELEAKQWTDLKKFTKNAYIDLQKMNDDAAEDELKKFKDHKEEMKFMEEQDPEVKILYNGQLLTRGEYDDVKKREADARKSQIEQAKKAIDMITDSMERAAKARGDIQQMADQKDIDRLERTLDVQMALAAQGKDNVLAETEAAIAKAEEKKIQDAKAAAKREEAIAEIKVFTEVLTKALEDNEPFFQAFAKAGAATAVTRAAFNQMAQFYEGTEDTGTTDKPLDENGGRPAIIHDNERIVPKRLNDKLGGMSNDEMVSKALAYDSPGLRDTLYPSTTDQSMSVSQFNSMQVAEMTREIKALRSDLKGKPVQRTNLGRLGEWTEEMQTENQKMIIHHKKSTARPPLNLHG